MTTKEQRYAAAIAAYPQGSVAEDIAKKEAEQDSVFVNDDMIGLARASGLALEERELIADFVLKESRSYSVESHRLLRIALAALSVRIRAGEHVAWARNNPEQAAQYAAERSR